MDSGKVVCPKGIPIEVWKCVGENGFIKLTKSFSEIF